MAHDVDIRAEHARRSKRRTDRPTDADSFATEAPDVFPQQQIAQHRLSNDTIRRAQKQPQSLRPSEVLTLQHTMGNQHVQRLLQRGKQVIQRDLEEQTNETDDLVLDVDEFDADEPQGFKLLEEEQTDQHTPYERRPTTSSLHGGEIYTLQYPLEVIGTLSKMQRTIEAGASVYISDVRGGRARADANDQNRTSGYAAVTDILAAIGG